MENRENSLLSNELNVLIDDKVQEIKDHFNTFVYEMDLLMHELDCLQKNKGDTESERS